MSSGLAFHAHEFEARAISPLREMGAYEALWATPGTSFKTLSEKFAATPGALPSEFVPPDQAENCAHTVLNRFREAVINRFGVRVHGAGEYPEKLRDAEHPIELLYYQGWWDLVASRSVAIVGTRNPSKAGLARTRKLVRYLVRDDFTIVSGLAAGIDTEAHTTAIAEGGRTIAVIGTPLTHHYPKSTVFEPGRKSARSHLREVLDDVEDALSAGASHSAVLDTLHNQGFSLTLSSFQSTLARLRRERRTG